MPGIASTSAIAPRPHDGSSTFMPTSIAAICPHGWVEFTVQQGTSRGDPQEPPEGYQYISPDRVWGLDSSPTTRTVDNFIQQLRAKLEVDPQDPAHIQTVRGIGYRFDV